ncbi:MAG TPA: RIP metalloprotease RseP [Fastidiosipila sp.]|nr:RIP metalloprotease RseP [Fastidiosipila sp.]
MTILGIVVGILLLSLIMILHELGHYLVGKRLGFKIEQFSLFMGPVLFERVRNGVRFNIKAFPIGASVSFAGMDEAIEGQTTTETSRTDPGLFYNRPRWMRALVIAAGPVVNFLSAILVFAIMFMAMGVAVPTQGEIDPASHAAMAGIEPGDTLYSIDGKRIRTQFDLSMVDLMRDDKAPVTVEYIDRTDNLKKSAVFTPEIIDTRYMLGISYVEEGGRFMLTNVDPRSNDGNPVLRPGDQIVAIDGVPFSRDESISDLLNQSGGKTLAVDIVRDGKEEQVEMATVQMDVYRPLGVSMTLSRSFGDAIMQGLHTPWSIVKSSVGALSMMFSGQLSARDNLTGPIGIVNMVGDVVKNESVDIGVRLGQLAMLFGLISVAVGFTNLLPIPPLDGNHLVILGVEGVLRKNLPERLKTAISYIGFALIIGLAVFVIYLDVSRLIGR